MKNVFFQEKSKEILLNLEESSTSSITDVSRAINGTYAHTFNIIRDLEGLNIVTSKKDGRTKFITLTERGEELAKLMRSFQEILQAKKIKPKPKKVKKQIKTTGGSEEKLNRYKIALETLNDNICTKKINRAKAARILGRYKALVSKSRPRTQKGRTLKDQINKITNSVTENLSNI